ncbi:hypothetical protein BO86DRAFT_220096 [Aspergillus japonicus CBS 114.51]|uniref:Uncharacterized protein n=1 Tax=Aspergillus japonicus CBS 114.51 TaxID=1448312 RepID=A0A8T8WNR1_ASPJA|nr:hypothetical protein BO86DRAFT_220096 [Aspergillus japonicus CBS 114.51]RAH77436.1 hypothetical protein BO86DRAFT_220096 [Aspergillus japonicus CBS 114.51]
MQPAALTPESKTRRDSVAPGKTAEGSPKQEQGHQHILYHIAHQLVFRLMPCTTGPRFEPLRPLPTIFAHLSVLIRLPFHCLLISLPPSPVLFLFSFPFYFLSKLSSSLSALEVEASSFGWLMVRSVLFFFFSHPSICYHAYHNLLCNFHPNHSCEAWIR